MEKRYIIVKGLSSSELLKALAQGGQPQINTIPITPSALCEEVLLTQGISLPGERINNQTGVFIMLKILREGINTGNRYFNSATYSDAAMCHRAVMDLRMQLTEVDEPEIKGISRLLTKPVVKAKNKAIVEELAEPYLDTLSRLNLLDSPALFRHLIAQISGSKKPLPRGRALFVNEYPVSPLERKLTTVIFGEDRIDHMSRDQLLGIHCGGSERTEGRLEWFSSYGSSNEMRTIIDQMIKSGEPLDSFVLASPKSESFAHLLREYGHINIPYTLGTGISGVHSQSYANGTLNFMPEISGGKELQSLAKSAGIAGFSDKELDEISPDIMKALSLTRIFKANSHEGKLHLMDLWSLPFINRKNVFIAGIEALAGTGNENAILLDGDITGIKAETENSDLLTSVEKTLRQSANFRWLIEFLKRQGKNITASYSYYDTASLKTQSKPAVFSAEEYGFAEIGDKGFFEKDMLLLSSEEDYMRSYKEGKRMKPLQANLAEERAIGRLPELHVSSTAAETLMVCPYDFFVEKILNIRMPEEPKDRTIWLDAKETGSLCHEIISLYSQKSYGFMKIEEKKALMLRIADSRIIDWQRMVPSLIDTTYEIENIKDICTKFVELKETMPPAETVGTEITMGDQPIIPGSLYIHGKADLVEKRQALAGEEIYVIDTKTGKNVKQIEDDIETCVQALIYCELLNRAAYPGKVAGAVYLYPKVGRMVSCSFNAGVSQSLQDRFESRMAAIERAEDWKSKDSDACAFCAAKVFCQSNERYRYFDSLIKGGFIL